MTKENFKIAIEEAQKYREVIAFCEEKLISLFPKYEESDFFRKKYNFSLGTPLGYAFLKKKGGKNLEIFDREPELFVWIDINDNISVEFSEFSDVLLSAKRRGSIKPFNWGKEQVDIIQKVDPYINAKFETIPIKVLHGNKVGTMKVKKQ